MSDFLMTLSDGGKKIVQSIKIWKYFRRSLPEKLKMGQN